MDTLCELIKNDITEIKESNEDSNVEKLRKISNMFMYQHKMFQSKSTVLKNAELNAFITNINAFFLLVVRQFENRHHFPPDKSLKELLNTIAIFFEIEEIRPALIPTMKLYIDSILDPSAEFSVIYGLLFSFESILRKVNSVEIKQRFYKENLICLYKLMDTLNTCGDYMFQQKILSSIFNLLPNNRSDEKLSYQFYPDDQQLAKILEGIKPETFDADCRNFLNHINAKTLTVISIKAKTVHGDSVNILPPSFLKEEAGIWVDFNTKSESVSIRCALKSLTDNIRAVELDDTIFINQSAIQSINVKSMKRQQIIMINLSEKLTLDTTLAESFQAKCRIVTIVVDKTLQQRDLVDTYLARIFGPLFLGNKNPSEMDRARRNTENNSIYPPLSVDVRSVAASHLTSLTEGSFHQKLCVDADDADSISESSECAPPTMLVLCSQNSSDQSVSFADAKEKSNAQESSMNAICGSEEKSSRLSRVLVSTQGMYFNPLPPTQNELELLSLESKTLEVLSLGGRMRSPLPVQSEPQDTHLLKVSVPKRNYKKITNTFCAMESISEDEEYMDVGDDEVVNSNMLIAQQEDGIIFDSNSNSCDSDRIKEKTPTEINKAASENQLSTRLERNEFLENPDTLKSTEATEKFFTANEFSPVQKTPTDVYSQSKSKAELVLMTASQNESHETKKASKCASGNAILNESKLIDKDNSHISNVEGQPLDVSKYITSQQNTKSINDSETLKLSQTKLSQQITERLNSTANIQSENANTQKSIDFAASYKDIDSLSQLQEKYVNEKEKRVGNVDSGRLNNSSLHSFEEFVRSLKNKPQNMGTQELKSRHRSVISGNAMDSLKNFSECFKDKSSDLKQTDDEDLERVIMSVSLVSFDHFVKDLKDKPQEIEAGEFPENVTSDDFADKIDLNEIAQLTQQFKERLDQENCTAENVDAHCSSIPDSELNKSMSSISADLESRSSSSRKEIPQPKLNHSTQCSSVLKIRARKSKAISQSSNEDDNVKTQSPLIKTNYSRIKPIESDDESLTNINTTEKRQIRKKFEKKQNLDKEVNTLENAEKKGKKVVNDKKKKLRGMIKEDFTMTKDKTCVNENATTSKKKRQTKINNAVAAQQNVKSKRVSKLQKITSPPPTQNDDDEMPADNLDLRKIKKRSNKQETTVGTFNLRNRKEQLNKNSSVIEIDADVEKLDTKLTHEDYIQIDPSETEDNEEIPLEIDANEIQIDVKIISEDNTKIGRINNKGLNANKKQNKKNKKFDVFHDDNAAFVKPTDITTVPKGRKKVLHDSTNILQQNVTNIENKTHLEEEGTKLKEKKKRIKKCKQPAKENVTLMEEIIVHAESTNKPPKIVSSENYSRDEASLENSDGEDSIIVDKRLLKKQYNYSKEDLSSQEKSFNSKNCSPVKTPEGVTLEDKWRSFCNNNTSKAEVRCLNASYVEEEKKLKKVRKTNVAKRKVFPVATVKQALEDFDLERVDDDEIVQKLIASRKQEDPAGDKISRKLQNVDEFIKFDSNDEFDNVDNSTSTSLNATNVKNKTRSNYREARIEHGLDLDITIAHHKNVKDVRNSDDDSCSLADKKSKQISDEMEDRLIKQSRELDEILKQSFKDEMFCDRTQQLNEVKSAHTSRPAMQNNKRCVGKISKAENITQKKVANQMSKAAGKNSAQMKSDNLVIAKNKENDKDVEQSNIDDCKEAVCLNNNGNKELDVRCENIQVDAGEVDNGLNKNASNNVVKHEIGTEFNAVVEDIPNNEKTSLAGSTSKVIPIDDDISIIDPAEPTDKTKLLGKQYMKYVKSRAPPVFKSPLLRSSQSEVNLREINKTAKRKLYDPTDLSNLLPLDDSITNETVESAATKRNHNDDSGRPKRGNNGPKRLRLNSHSDEDTRVFSDSSSRRFENLFKNICDKMKKHAKAKGGRRNLKKTAATRGPNSEKKNESNKSKVQVLQDIRLGDDAASNNKTADLLRKIDEGQETMLNILADIKSTVLQHHCNNE